MSPGLKTLNGRFILLISVTIVALFALTFYAQYEVTKSSSRGLEYIHANRDLNSSVTDLKNSLQLAESALHQYSTFLSNEHREKVFVHLDQLQSRADELRKSTLSKTTDALTTRANQLHDDILRLREIIAQYVIIMQDVESRYPAMPILLTHLEPTNRKFSEAVELALQEAELTEFRPKLIERDHHRIIQLFQEARYAWAMQISWFRIFIANRMGAFGEPEVAMSNNLRNREMFAKTVDETLDKLDEYNKKGLLGIQQEESLSSMREALLYYNIFLEKATTIYFSKDWRADASLLSNALQPALDRTWETANALERAIAEINNIGIAESQKTSNRLSYFIWFFAGIVVLMLILAFSAFQRRIRQPVLELANSMANEDPLKNSIPISEGNTVEIDKLIRAYTQMRAQVYNKQNRLESILDTAAEGIITIDEEGKIESFNTAAQRLFGYTSSEIKGCGISIITSRELENEFINGQITSKNNERELDGIRQDGTRFFMSFKVSKIESDDRLYTAIVDDISERRAAMDHLRHLAEHDSLTGLHNRQYFNDALERAFAQASRKQENNCACIYIDLDNFKYVNDTLGHLEGDRLLIGIAHTLKKRTRKGDILARLGGDEFALLLQQVNKQQIEKVAEGYREAIAGFSFIADGKHFGIGCSIGIALFEKEIENKEALLSRADIACHMAKRAGRNRVHIFENEDRLRINSLYEEMGWSRRIREALDNDYFVFACQPVITIEDCDIYSHELLLRMVDPETNDYIMPGGFLDAADRFGLLPEIDRWVIEHAFQWINEQPDDGKLCYFINLSGKSIGDEQLFSFIKLLQASLKISSARIVFEITEDVAIAELDKAKQFITDLHGLGFRCALDDFGVGYSSFSYLREFDVDFIKIDGSFINSMKADELNYALVKAINDICHILGKLTIAEYVQDEESIALLKEIGVDYAQGYNIAKASDYDQDTIQFRIA